MRWGLIVLMATIQTDAAKAETDRPERGVLTLQIENDLFAGLDEQYTNGTYLNWTQPTNELPLIGRALRDGLTGVVTAPEWRMSYGVGQSMFTPDDITIPDPPEDERPYAGFLFVSAQLSADSVERLDTFGFDIGVTGPPSLAETTQKFIHNDLGIGDTPRGWGTQLKTEVAFRLLYEQKRRFGTELSDAWGWLSGLEAEAIPHLALALGTVDTSAAAAVTFRLGQGLDMDWGTPRVRRSVAPSLRPATPGAPTRWNVFAGAGLRAVARDLFLDGNTFRDSRSTDKEPLVADLSLGAAYDFGPVVLSYTHVLRSPDFEARDDWSQFGSLSLRVPF
jgi:hypothetical protein